MFSNADLCIVGEVGEIEVKPDTVQAILKIEKADLLLPRPVIARLVKNSLLGGDVQVALLTSGKSLPQNPPWPVAKDCLKKQILCEGALIEGEPLTSISTLTSEIERIVRKAGEAEIIENLIQSTKQFDQTQKELEELKAKG